MLVNVKLLLKTVTRRHGRKTVESEAKLQAELKKQGRIMMSARR